MLISNRIKALSNLSRSLTFKPTKSYVKQKQIDEISKTYGQGNWEKMKMYAAIFKHIGIEGLKGAKEDLHTYSEIRNKQPLTPEQTLQMIRITNDAYKLGPLIVIQILPFSGPLFMLYMYTYPGSIPSWFMIDYYHDRHEELKLQNQTKALKQFQEKGFKSQDINLDTMSLRDLRKLCLLLFGIYRDGTVGYRKLFNQKIPHFLFEGYSKFLIKRDMQKRFRRDIVLSKMTSQMETLEEMVKWKFDKIMKGEFRFEYKPMYENTLEKMKTNEGEQSVMFKEIEKDNITTQNQTKTENPNQQNKK